MAQQLALNPTASCSVHLPPMAWGSLACQTIPSKSRRVLSSRVLTKPQPINLLPAVTALSASLVSVTLSPGVTILMIVLLYTSDESDVKVRGSMYVSVSMYVERACMCTCLCICTRDIHVCLYMRVNVCLKGMSLSDH